ncbi:MAG: phenylacetate-CoA oxygenase subunit PaaJ [Sphaerobacter sp.]|nr:phenylacetate-CoA oxygenase subunit PaaJ [Sphaerobacter sp.]
MQTVSEEQVWEALREIPDPEIPTINVVDLGIIRQVAVADAVIRVEMMPTFVGCPAIDMMRRDIRERLGPFGPVEVVVVYDEPWTTERITAAGRRMLLQAGLAPPPRGDIRLTPVSSQPVPCPYCGSTDTQIENLFGPTPCRSIFYCRACRQPFEQFKAV